MARKSCEGQHIWPRASNYESKTIGWFGRKWIYTCNECFAVKVIIETDQEDGSVDRVEQVVEPAPRK